MYGLLGKNISYSYSPLIFKYLGYDYKLYDVDKEELKDILLKKDFLGLNVTIPYKQEVIKYLDVVDDSALKLNSVNTIVNKDGVLYGYNSDYPGLKYALENNNVNVLNKKVLILGSGKSSEMVSLLMNDLKAKDIIVVSRSGSVNYNDLSAYRDFEIIINTTPVGTYPNIFDTLINVDDFLKLEAVVDLTYNPLNTKLIVEAKLKNIKAFGGLKMLVAQALYSSAYFFDKKVSDNDIIDTYKALANDKLNVVLIGMPTAGKSSVGKKLAQKLNKEFIDIDELIVEDSKKSIVDIFNEDGQDFFRLKESLIIRNISHKTNCVIASGGGVILNKENIKNLMLNGVIVFIDRPLELLQKSDNRPLSTNRSDLEDLYNKRIDLYNKYAQIKVLNDKSIEDIVKEISIKYYENISN